MIGFRGKLSFLLILVFLGCSVTVLTISMVDSVTPLPTAEAISDEDITELCMLLNTYIDTGFVDWGGYFICCGKLKGMR